MDKLDQLIVAKQTELDDLKGQIASLGDKHERVLIELEALRAAAAARPAARRRARAIATEAGGKRRGGRSAGDISHEWRKVLRQIHTLNRRVSYSDVFEIATSMGIQTKMPNVRERMRSMSDNGLLSGDAESGFLVTEEAIQRFGLAKELAA